ncbi:MAG: PGPGW domain-containing protein [Gammaproteobacteria bacterium]|nr:PGPGW domain-containing protein [Gammaproteobacteria bacterium]
MKVPTPLRRVVVLIVGGTILLTGLVMLVTPGPGLVVILVGLATLASEFPWARRLLTRVREETGTRGRQAGSWWRRLRGRNSSGS